MRKIGFLVFAIMIFAMLLSACNAEGLNGNRNTGLIGETPGSADNGVIPETGDADLDLTVTPELVDDLDADADNLSGVVDTQTPVVEVTQEAGDDSSPKGWTVDETATVESDDANDGDDQAGEDAFSLPLTGAIGRGERFSAEDPNLFALSELDGMAISNPDGVEIGRVAGVVLDEDRLQVRYLLLDRDEAGDGVLIAVPLRAFHFDEQTRVIPKRSSERANPSERGQERGRGHQEQVISSTVLLLDVDEAALNDAPGFPGAGEWRGWRGSASELDSYWRDAGYELGDGSDADAVIWLDLDQLREYQIRLQGDQVIGAVEDLVIDFETGDVRYLLAGSDLAQGYFLLIPADGFTRQGLEDSARAFLYNGDLNDLQDLQWVESREELYWDIEQ